MSGKGDGAKEGSAMKKKRNWNVVAPGDVPVVIKIIEVGGFVAVVVLVYVVARMISEACQ